MRHSASTDVVVDESFQLELTEFALVCGTTTVTIEELVREGVLTAREQALGFSGEEVMRVRRALRLQRDFEATLPSVAVMLELLDEIGRLRGRLRRAGIEEN